jgi:hypothetical protein
MSRSYYRDTIRAIQGPRPAGLAASRPMGRGLLRTRGPGGRSILLPDVQAACACRPGRPSSGPRRRCGGSVAALRSGR